MSRDAHARADANEEHAVTDPTLSGAHGYELHFHRLAAGGVAYVFRCDAEGKVDLDALSERARDNYLFARAMVGAELVRPKVVRCSPGCDERGRATGHQ
jgi:hypothetical protein